MSRQKTERLIETIIQENLAADNVIAVQIDRDTDFDDEPVFLIKVIVDNGNKRIDSKKTISLTRDVRTRLAELGESAFPVFSFISKQEAGKLTTAAA